MITGYPRRGVEVEISGIGTQTLSLIPAANLLVPDIVSERSVGRTSATVLFLLPANWTALLAGGQWGPAAPLAFQARGNLNPQLPAEML